MPPACNSLQQETIDLKINGGMEPFFRPETYATRSKRENRWPRSAGGHRGAAGVGRPWNSPRPCLWDRSDRLDSSEQRNSTVRNIGRC